MREGVTLLYAADVTPLEDPALYAAAYAAASPARREKTDRCGRPGDRRLSLGAELLLRHALREAGFGGLPLEYTFGRYGKPELKAGGPHFSLSHSGRWALCALSGRETGCDVERIAGRDPRVARRFAPEEREAILSREGEERQKLFCRCWTLKESFLKAAGAGLSLPLNAFSVLPGEETRMSRSIRGRVWSFREFSDLTDCCCAVCTEGGSEEAELRIVPLTRCGETGRP